MIEELAEFRELLGAYIPKTVCDFGEGFHFTKRPLAIETWFAYSRRCMRPLPSAMFAGTETAARRIWLVRPYIS